MRSRKSAEFDAGQQRQRADILLHELQIHQIELKMQNENLRCAQEELQDARDRYFSLYDLAPVGYLLLSTQGLILEANLTFAAMLGMTKQELQNQPLSRFIFCDDQDTWHLQCRRLFEACTPSAVEMRLMKQDGARLWIRLEMNLTQEIDGEPIVRAMALDITQRKKAEEDQRRSAEMQGILRKIAEAAIVLPLDELYNAVHQLVARVLPANHFLISMLDEAAGEVVVVFRADTAQDVPERRPMDKGLIEYILRLGRTSHLSAADLARLREQGEYSLLDGQRSKVREYLGAPLTDSQGKAFGAISLVFMEKNKTFQPEDAEVLSIIAAQVSLAVERKQMEKALIESEIRFRTLIENVTDIVFSITTEGIVTYASPNWTKALGHPLSSLLGHAFIEFVHPEDLAHSLASLRRMVDTGESQHGVECRVRNKNGEWKWYSASANSVRDDSGNVVSFIGILHAIDERKKAELALQASQARYHALIYQSFEALALIDVETREIVEINPRFTEMLGYSLPEHAPLYVHQFVMDSQSVMDRIASQITLHHLHVLPEETRSYRHKNGNIVVAERAGTVIRFEDRDYLLTSLRDTTEERSRQAQLARDVEVARQVQRELLTELPDSPLVDVRTLYYPSHFVSGDSYHMEWLNAGTLLRGYLLDVSGHGLATALQTASFGVLLREAATSKLSLLGQMKRINARAAKCFAEGSYATMLGFELDLTRGELRYVGAGVTQFFVNGRKIKIPGMFVGIWDEPKFSVETLSISPGDTVHFLTDGFTDALAQPENQSCWSPDGTDFDADVASLARLAESGKLRDDATGICLKIKGQEGSR